MDELVQDIEVMGYRIELLERALQFYADPKIYLKAAFHQDGLTNPLIEDSGKLAREVLGI